MKTTIHYSVMNCGDGSAYPKFCETERIAEIHQDVIVNGYEGWGERCTGSITIQSDGPIFVLDVIFTKNDLIEELEECRDWYSNTAEIDEALKELNE